MTTGNKREKAAARTYAKSHGVNYTTALAAIRAAEEIPMTGDCSTAALDQMRQRARPGTRWAAYRNKALDSADCGRLVFLMVGEGCTFAEPPLHAPDGAHGLGWKYLPAGFVDLATGLVQP